MVSLSLSSFIILLAIAAKFKAFPVTNSSYQFGELNNKLTYLQQRLDLFDVITEGNVSMLLHRVEVNDLRYAENVTLQLAATNEKLKALEGKLNALASTVTDFVGAIKATIFKPISSCVDAFARPLLNRGSGVYNIQLSGNTQPFDVYCMADPMGGLPWTVVQRRVDGSTNFHRNWTEYKRGFGDLGRNLFIGLDKLHWLTGNEDEPQELWVQLTYPDGSSKNAYYDSFAIDSEANKYQIRDLGEYSGDAGDGLESQRGNAFSTFDRDNDVLIRNCAQDHKGAWWFNYCFIGDLPISHLNGIYGATGYGKGLIWDNVRGIQYAHMAIRPIRK